MRSFIPLLVLGLAACATSSVNEPSLARRPAEAIDPRLPIDPNPIPGPADATLAARLAAFVADGKAGARSFDSEVDRAQSLAEVAGPAQSDSWIVAQEAVSGLEAARARTTRALADIDALAAERVQMSGGISPGDIGAVEVASAELRAVSGRQSAIIEQLATRLAR